MVAIAELMKKGGTARDSTSREALSVGVKKMVGGMLAACVSSLNPSSTIQSTGKKKMNATTQASAVLPTLAVGKGAARRVGATLSAGCVVATFIVVPPR